VGGVYAQPSAMSGAAEGGMEETGHRTSPHSL
jgi:hypothetical protein